MKVLVRMMATVSVVVASGLGCAGGDDGHAVMTAALVTAPATEGTATVRMIGATDWEATGRVPLQLNVLLDGEPVGWELGSPAIATWEGSGVSFGAPAGPWHVSLASKGEVIWDFGVQTLVAGQTTDLIWFGSPETPGVLSLEDVATGLPESQAAARLINLDDERRPIRALLCPEQSPDLDACEVAAEGIVYGEVWTGVVDVAARQLLRWERPAPADYPLDRFVGGASVPVGSPLCQGSAPLSRTMTLIPVHASTPEEAPDCPFCSSGWRLGDGVTPGDCAW